MTTRDHSRAEAAEILGVSIKTVQRLLSKGRLGFYRHGSRVTIGDTHIEEYRSSVEVKASAKLRRVS
jgi:excisionase family DNA binding protein